MGEIIKGPWSKSHTETHRDLFDNLIHLVYEFDSVIFQEGSDSLPKKEDGHLDLSQIPISLLIQWAMLQAQEPFHDHGENNEVLIRSRRNPSDGGPNKEGS